VSVGSWFRFGLFVHPFSHICNIGHCGHRVYILIIIMWIIHVVEKFHNLIDSGGDCIDFVEFCIYLLKYSLFAVVLIELLWVISYTRSTGAQPLLI